MRRRNAIWARAALLVATALVMPAAVADVPPYTWWTNVLSGFFGSMDLEETDSITICDKAAQFYTDAASSAGSTSTYHAGPPNVCCGSTPTTTLAGPPRDQEDFRMCRIYKDGGTGDGEYNVLLVPNKVAFFVSVKKPIDHGACCDVPGKVHVNDPINPATGNVFASDTDLTASALAFRRYYNSADAVKGSLGSGWRHSYSRQIRNVPAAVIYHAFENETAPKSSLYGSAADACVSGFGQIKSNVSSWAAASASFSDGACLISRSGTTIGVLPVRITSKYLTTAVAADLEAVRDDGMVLRFPVQGSALINPLSTGIRLQLTSGGYKLIDNSDNVELYDAVGKLLSVTSRGGVVQTTGYDSSGRLSTVTDSFGHSLTLTYDAQGRLSTVTR